MSAECFSSNFESVKSSQSVFPKQSFWVNSRFGFQASAEWFFFLLVLALLFHRDGKSSVVFCCVEDA